MTRPVATTDSVGDRALTNERRCASCGRRLAPEMRPQAECCSPACRAERSRTRRGFPPRGAEGSACPVCGASLAHRRKGAVYCGGDCKRRAARGREEAARSRKATLHLANDSETAQSRAEPLLSGRHAKPTCPYLNHRETDWLSIHGVAVCGVCHPPAIPALVRTESAVARRAA
jgi:hypothetical protein